MLRPTVRGSAVTLTLMATIFLSSCRTQPETVTVEVTRVVMETVVKTVPVAVEVEVEVTPVQVAQQAPPQKDLVVCMPQEPATLYPYGSYSAAEESVLHAIFENNITNLSYGYQAQGIEKVPTLTNGGAVIRDVQVSEGDRVVDANGNVVLLKHGTAIKTATDEQIAYDGSPIRVPQMVVDFTLKPRVWADGQPVTAEDSVFSFKLEADPDTPTSKYLIERTVNYEAIGDLGLRWTGLPGFLDSNYATNIWRPLPRHQWQGFNATDLLTADESNHMPVGDGPFRIEEWVVGEMIRLKPNSAYYRADEGLPYLDAVTFRFIPNIEQLVNQALSGRCDIVTQDGLSLNQVPLLLEASENGLLVPYFQTGSVFELIDFGIDSWGRYGDGIGRPDWFEDPRVRQAMLMCTDRQRMVDEVLYGRSQIIHSYLPSAHPLYADGIIEWPYDVRAANALLDAVGYLDTDGDGTREDPISARDFRAALTLVSTYEVSLGLGQIFRENQRDCGIDIELHLLPASEWYANGSDSPLFGRRFDLGQHAWPAEILPPCFLFSSWQITGPAGEKNRKSGQLFGGWGAANATGWSDPEFDAACRAAMNALPGTAVYEDNHKAAQRILAESVPVIPLFMRLKVAAAQPDVRNFSLDPTQSSGLWNLFEIDLHQ